MENILELKSLSKTFPKSDFVLDNVSFSLPYGAIMGFVGENGAGKTTTIGCILNTIAKDNGTVKLFGKEMLDADTDMREKSVLYMTEIISRLIGRQGNYHKSWEDFIPNGITHYSRNI